MSFSCSLPRLSAFWRFLRSFCFCFICAFARLKYRYLWWLPKGKNEDKTLIYRYKNTKNN
jgi:hypothetical protein